jgi:hypothetical protein
VKVSNSASPENPSSSIATCFLPRSKVAAFVLVFTKYEERANGKFPGADNAGLYSTNMIKEIEIPSLVCAKILHQHMKEERVRISLMK